MKISKAILVAICCVVILIIILLRYYDNDKKCIEQGICENGGCDGLNLTTDTGKLIKCYNATTKEFLCEKWIDKSESNNIC
jgi:hypothetical protein